MKRLFPLQLILLFALACTFTWPFAPSTPTATASPIPASPTATLTMPPPPPPSYSLYENQKYGFSISYPNIWPLTVQSDEYIEIGDRVVIGVLTTDPTLLHGDGIVFDNSSDVQPGAYPAKLLTGYIGSVGGYVPQQIRMFVFEHNGYYITFTLYALGLKTTEGDMSQIAPINPEVESIFNNIVAGLQFQ